MRLGRVEKWIMARTKNRACSGKDGFPYRDNALDRMYALVRKQGARLASMQVYKCKFCKLYHVGHVGYRGGKK